MIEDVAINAWQFAGGLVGGLMGLGCMQLADILEDKFGLGEPVRVAVFALGATATIVLAAGRP